MSELGDIEKIMSILPNGNAVEIKSDQLLEYICPYNIQQNYLIPLAYPLVRTYLELHSLGREKEFPSHRSVVYYLGHI